MKISTFLVHGSDLEARLCFLLLIEDPLIQQGNAAGNKYKNGAFETSIISSPGNSDNFSKIQQGSADRKGVQIKKYLSPARCLR
jgi:hypothetical protein